MSRHKSCFFVGRRDEERNSGHDRGNLGQRVRRKLGWKDQKGMGGVFLMKWSMWSPKR